MPCEFGCCCLNCYNVNDPQSFVAKNPRFSKCAVRCLFPLITFSSNGANGYALYDRVKNWDLPLMASQPIQNFYSRHPVVSHIVLFPLNVVRGALKFCTDQLLAVICSIVFPIIALIKWDKNYGYAAAYALFGTLFTAALVGIYFLNPVVGIKLAISLAAIQGIYEGVKSLFPRTYANYHPNTGGWHAACS